jgi:hypothetical protein
VRRAAAKYIRVDDKRGVIYVHPGFFQFAGQATTSRMEAVGPGRRALERIPSEHDAFYRGIDGLRFIVTLAAMALAAR